MHEGALQKRNICSRSQHLQGNVDIVIVNDYNNIVKDFTLEISRLAARHAQKSEKKSEITQILLCKVSTLL